MRPFPNRPYNNNKGVCLDPSILGAEAGTTNPYCTSYSWQWQINSYLKNNNVYVCPSSTGRSYKKTVSANTDSLAVPIPTSYGINIELYPYSASDPSGPNDIGPISLSQTTAPSSTYFIADASVIGFNGNWIDRVRYANISLNDPNLKELSATCKLAQPYYSATLAGITNLTEGAKRHQGGENIVFADGHAQFRPIGRISCGRGDVAPEGPNL
jgi:prepilin-type processing-associated H-X9-DG protein